MDLRACALPDDLPTLTPESLWALVQGKPLAESVTPTLVKALALAKEGVLDAGNLRRREVSQAALWLSDQPEDEWF